MRQALAGTSARPGVGRPRFEVHAVQQQARVTPIPAPVAGWNTIKPLAGMAPTDAVTLDNLFPQAGWIEIRGGHATHASTGIASAVESLLPYHALNSINDKLYAAIGTNIYDVTSTATSTASIPVGMSSLSNARWQHVNFSNTSGNYLWICNGADVPRYWNASAWATASITGVTAADIVNVSIFKKRLWLVINQTLSPAYLETNAIQGTATPFDLSGVFQDGGYLQAIGTWSLDGGDGPDDDIAFISSRGEIALYSGTDPESQFDLIGIFRTGAPLGRRCVKKIGPDLAVISKDGVEPLSRALITDRAAAQNASITRNIQPTMTDSARQYGANFGWEILAYPHGNRIILNVPIAENTLQYQYVMNAITGAWCRFKGENANCWALFQDKLYFGNNSGKVKLADTQGFDDDGNIDYDLETAFNTCETPGRLKNFVMAQPLLTTDGQTDPGIAINVDFARQTPVNQVTTPTVPLVYWDSGVWDTDSWPETERQITNWIAVDGVGSYGSVRLKGTASSDTSTDDLTFQINSINLLVLDGDYI